MYIRRDERVLSRWCGYIGFLKKRRADYFSKRGYKLIGCEVPIDVDLKKNVKIVGYLDLVILDEDNTIKIYDIKTSTRGWNKWMKKDENKTQQLLLYKQFYAKTIQSSN